MSQFSKTLSKNCKNVEILQRGSLARYLRSEEVLSSNIFRRCFCRNFFGTFKGYHNIIRSYIRSLGVLNL